MPLFAPLFACSSIFLALVCRIRCVCCIRFAARSKPTQLLALRLALCHLCLRLCPEELVREIRVGRVAARFLVKLAKQTSNAAAAGAAAAGAGAAAAIALLALFAPAHGHGLCVAAHRSQQGLDRTHLLAVESPIQ